jgi:hypothetical protein
MDLQTAAAKAKTWTKQSGPGKAAGMEKKCRKGRRKEVLNWSQHNGCLRGRHKQSQHKET